MHVLVYQDYVHNNGLLYHSLTRCFGHDCVSFCDADDIAGGVLNKSVKLFVMPGGADLYFAEKLDGQGTDNIRAYVENGGRYMGICAGAYYACESLKWAADQGDCAITGERPLKFFPGVAAGPVYDFIEERDFSKSWMGAPTLHYDDGRTALTLPVLYRGGPVFVPGQGADGFDVLGRYGELPGEPAAVVECAVGRGKAILCSPHLECAGDRLPHTLYRHNNPSCAWEAAIAGKLSSYARESRQLWDSLLHRAVLQHTESPIISGLHPERRDLRV